MKKFIVKSSVALLSIVSTAWLFADETAELQENDREPQEPSFTELFNEHQDGMQLLRDYFREKYKWIEKRRTITTYDCGCEGAMYVELARLLLNETAITQAAKLSPKDADLLMHSHLAWLRYFKNSPSRPTDCEQGSGRACYGDMVDQRRMTARLDAVKLPWEQYKIYAKIANSCLIPMEDGKHKLQFGEVKQVQEAPWSDSESDVRNYGKVIYYYPVFLVADTCRMIQTGKSFCYCAIIKHHRYTDTNRILYFCVWEPDGSPRAMYQLCESNEDDGKVKELTIDGDNVKIVFENLKYKSFTFNVLKRNKKRTLPR